MARIRTTKPSFWGSSTVAKLSRDARLTTLGLDQDEARDMHARYFNGCREPRTVVGERVYQRRKKRAQYAKRRAA